jgi:hypothetical protein
LGAGEERVIVRASSPDDAESLVAFFKRKRAPAIIKLPENDVGLMRRQLNGAGEFTIAERGGSVVGLMKVLDGVIEQLAANDDVIKAALIAEAKTHYSSLSRWWFATDERERELFESSGFVRTGPVSFSPEERVLYTWTRS